MASAAIKTALRGIEGADAHGDDWFDTIVTQLASQGIHDASELNGAVFDDFEFASGALNGAQKRVIRKAIERASKGGEPPRSPQMSEGSRELKEGTEALVALLGRKEEVSRGARPRWTAPFDRARSPRPK